MQAQPAHGFHFWRKQYPVAAGILSSPMRLVGIAERKEGRGAGTGNLPKGLADFSPRRLISQRCLPGTVHGTDWTLSGRTRVSLGVVPGLMLPGDGGAEGLQLNPGQ